jgi:hypothetical protein
MSANLWVPALLEAQRAEAKVRLQRRSNGAALTTVVDQWTEDLARRRSQGAGSDWIWYRAGGLDALEQLADALTRGEG